MDLESLRIETPRLILRVPRVEDLDGWAAMMADEQAARFIGGAAPREATWRGLMTVIGASCSRCVRSARYANCPSTTPSNAAKATAPIVSDVALAGSRRAHLMSRRGTEGGLARVGLPSSQRPISWARSSAEA